MQELLQRHSRSGAAAVRNQFGALLKGLLRSVPCDSAMTPAHSTTKKSRRYQYYTCCSAQKRGWDTCPSKSIPAGEIERFVVEQIKCIGTDPALRRKTFAQACAQVQSRLAELETERRVLARDLARRNDEVRTLLIEMSQSNGGGCAARLADLPERRRTAEQRAVIIDEEIATIRRERIHEDEVDQALADFGTFWDALAPREQARVVHLLVERVDYDSAAQTVSITFHPAGIKALADEITARQREQST